MTHCELRVFKKCFSGCSSTGWGNFNGSKNLIPYFRPIKFSSSLVCGYFK